MAARLVHLMRALCLVFACSACRPAPGVSPASESEPLREPSSIPEEPSAGGEQESLRARFDAAPALATQSGEASYYSDALAGRSTASGDPYDPAKFTAAHRKLPFGSIVRVVRVDDGRSVYVRINDRGPFGKRTRVLDVSRSAAEALEMTRAGVVQVRLEVVESSDASRLR